MRAPSFITALAIATISPVAAACAVIADAQPIAFKVLRAGAPTGVHRVSFARAGDTLTVHIDIDLEV